MRTPELLVTTWMATAVAVLVGACGSDPVLLPSEPGALATVVVIDRAGTISATALEGDGSGFEVAADLDGDLSANILYYEATLPEVGLAAGPLVAALPNAPWRPLPMFDRAKLLTVVDGASLGFETILELTEAAKNFHLGLLDAIRCIAAGGCASSANETAGCALPCPTPTPVEPPEAPALPEPPRAPVLTPCAMGWTETRLINETVCLPPARTSCLRADEVQWVDSAACERLEACPAGTFAPDLPVGAVVYVDPSGPAGDGSLATPFSTLAAALTSNADVIALAAGDYPSQPIDRAVAIVGRCQWLSTLSGELAINATVKVSSVTITGRVLVDASADLELSNAAIIGSSDDGIESAGKLRGDSLSIVGSAALGVWITGGTTRLDRVVIAGSGAGGVRATGTASVSVEHFVIESTRATAESNGRGIDVREDGRINATSGLVEAATARGVSAVGGALVTKDVVIRRTQSSAEGRGGTGIYVEGQAIASFSRTYIEETKAAGIVVDSAMAMLSDLIVHDVVARQSDQLDGQGLMIKGEGLAVVERAHVELTTRAGISVDGPGSRATLRDVVVKATRSNANDRALGQGIAVNNGASIELERVRVEQSRHHGLEVINHSSASGRDLTVVGTLSEESTGGSGQGISLTHGSTLTLERYLGRDNQSAGLETAFDGRCVLSDVTISGTTPPTSEGYDPSGIKLRGGSAVISRATLVDNVYGGLEIQHDGVDAQIDDLSVRGSTIQGVRISNGARASGHRWSIVDNGSEGINLSGITALTVEDISISGSTGGNGRVGVGLIVDFAHVRLERFAITDNMSFGVTFADGDLDLRDGTIAHHRVGISLAPTNYDLARLSHGVVFANDVDFEQQ